MFRIINIVIAGVVLTICMFQDIRFHRIYALLPAAGCLAGLLLNSLYDDYSIVSAICDMSVGGSLAVYSLISRGKIGLGDCIIMLMLGITLGMYNAGLIMLISSMISAVYMGIRKKHSMPFIPAVMFTYIVTVLLNT